MRSVSRSDTEASDWRGTTTYEVTVDVLIADVERVCARLFASQKVPRVAVVRPLQHADSGAVSLLCGELFCAHDLLLHRLNGEGHSAGFLHTHSAVLVLGEQIRGAALVQAESSVDAAFLYGIVIDPSLRRTWATPLLKRGVFLQLQAHGVRMLRFQAVEDARDSRNHARRVGAKVLVDSVRAS